MVASACTPCGQCNGGDGYMSYVGDGGGDWIEETTYKYVGNGLGDFDVGEGPRHEHGHRRNWCCIVGVGLSLVAAAVVVMLALMGPDVATTTMSPEGAPAADGRGVTLAAGAEAAVETTASSTSVQPEDDNDVQYDCQAGFAIWQTIWSADKKDWCCKAVGRGCPAVASEGTSSTTAPPAPAAAPPAQPPAEQPAQVPAESPAQPPLRPAGQPAMPLPPPAPPVQPAQPAPPPQPAQPQPAQPAQPAQAGQVAQRGALTPPPPPPTAPPPPPPVAPAAQEVAQLPQRPEFVGQPVTLPGQPAALRGQPLLQVPLQGVLPMQPGQPRPAAPLGPLRPLMPQMLRPQAPQSLQVPPPGLQVPMQAAPPPGPRTVVLPLFDCDAGFINWQVGWSVSKRAWCCQQTGRACPIMPGSPQQQVTLVPQVPHAPPVRPLPPPPAPPPGAHGTPAGPVAPLVGGHNCAANFATWRLSWTPEKKAWCCEREGKGCEQVLAAQPPAAGLPPALGPPRPPPPMVRPGAPIPIGEMPFDCAAGLANWEKGWSVAKKQWCCQHGGSACPLPDPSE